MSRNQHHVHWEYLSASEFSWAERKEDEYFDTFDAAKARVQELLLNWSDRDFQLKVTWYDGDDTGLPYRHFEVSSPDRG